MVNGFGWAWIVLGDSRGAQRILAALDAAGDAAPAADRAERLLLAAWIEASTGHLDLAREHIAAATDARRRIGDVDLQARCAYYLAYVVSHDGDFHHALELTDRSRALYDGLDRPWDQAANWLFAARAAISAGDEERSVEAVDQVAALAAAGRRSVAARPRRGHARASWPASSTGSTTPSSTSAAPRRRPIASASGRPRPTRCPASDGRSARPVTTTTGAATLELAIEKAEATGDVRLAALARVHLGRVLRALGQPTRARTALEAAAAWHRVGGGGEQAALGECLLAALDAADGVPGAEDRLTGDPRRRRRSTATPPSRCSPSTRSPASPPTPATSSGRGPLREADRRMEAASHFITDLDRTDAAVGQA